MKKKLYYILFPLYLLMTLFILYINGIFTGNPTSRSNLMINLGFLLIIAVLFALSTVSFGRLSRCADELEAAADTLERERRKNKNAASLPAEQKDLFRSDALREAFARFQRRSAAAAGKKGLSGSCDPEEYLNDELINRIGLMHFNSAISGTLTGLGILGTFLGLSMGMRSFSGSDIYTISDNVGPLLDGMKVAFHTSVYGIFFSLVFNFVYRAVFSAAYEALSRFLTVCRECSAPAAGTEEGTRAMLVYQSGMASSLKSILELQKGAAAQQTEGMERMINQFMQQLSQTLGTEFGSLGTTLKQAGAAQTQCAQDYRAMADTSQELLDTIRSIQTELGQLRGQQEEFSRKLNLQQETLTATCDALSSEISSQLYTLEQTRNSYED